MAQQSIAYTNPADTIAAGMAKVQANFTELYGLYVALPTCAYASATTFTMSGDYTAVIGKGTKIKLTQTTAKYFYAASASYAGGVTTVTIYANTSYTLANAAITLPNYANGFPFDFPGLLSYTPTFTGFSADPGLGTCQYKVIDGMCFAAIKLTTNGTSNATTFTISLPITAKITAGAEWYTYTTPTDNGAIQSTPGLVIITSGATTAAIYKNASNTAFTNTGAKNCFGFDIWYPV
jgi:hypothetical protein